MIAAMRFCLVILALAVHGTVSLESEEFLQFIEDCADGKVEEVTAALTKNSEWASEATPEGETCLHVAGIHGELEVTRALMKAGVDPNIVSHMMDEPEDEPIKMHALSWHVFGGHVKSAELLLDHGADPNQLLDSLDGDQKRVTVLDMLDQLLEEEAAEASEDEIAPFKEMRDMLVKRGAKRKDEL